MISQHPYKNEPLFNRIAALTREVTRLPRSGAGSYQREQIEWELVRLRRRLGSGTSDTLHRHPVLAQMWHAVEAHVDDTLVRERIKQSWLNIRV
ncbi:MAG: hypothetical protein ACE5G0_16020 [Rhodothermales bacterium]